MNLFHYCSGIHFLRLLSQSLMVGALSTVGLLAGLTPSLSGRSPALEFSTAAIAQAINDGEVAKYAQIVLSLEPIRKAAIAQIETIVGPNNVPAIVCSDTNNVNALPGKVREIAVKFCTDSKTIVESNGLNITRFNLITRSLQNNPTLEQRIQQEMIRIRQSSGSQ